MADRFIVFIGGALDGEVQKLVTPTTFRVGEPRVDGPYEETYTRRVITCGMADTAIFVHDQISDVEVIARLLSVYREGYRSEHD